MITTNSNNQHDNKATSKITTLTIQMPVMSSQESAWPLQLHGKHTLCSLKKNPFVHTCSVKRSINVYIIVWQYFDFFLKLGIVRLRINLFIFLVADSIWYQRSLWKLFQCFEIIKSLCEFFLIQNNIQKGGWGDKNKMPFGRLFPV